MIVVHMDSGLGNQMLDYVEYLAVKETNPDQEVYIEKLIYDIPHHEGMFSMWNGYELERIFGINPPDIKDILSVEAYSNILAKVEKSEFWKDNWNYGPYIRQALEDEGIKLIRYGRRIDLSGKSTGQGNSKAFSLEEEQQVLHTDIDQNQLSTSNTFRSRLTFFFKNTSLGYHIKRIARQCNSKRLTQKCGESYDLFKRYPDNAFVGHSLAFRYSGIEYERIDALVRKTFKFPAIEEADLKNMDMLKLIQGCNAVSIHARRGDMLSLNGHCYTHGYFKRAVRYIKKHVDNPVFIFFTDETSVGWCQENEDIFGLDFAKDKVYFVDWNIGEQSFRDMQLMAQCHHNIFTESSFGFWGAYLNEHKDKITCSPDPLIMATNCF